ncbi:hypothetical protein HKK74_04495 [Actinomadura alba]|uniref:Uncharacterized protein n=2 Tax=Actinomadura alba TaxID=406431 RepID=A0ABR7LK47_9ACTN|nr:hypothetical protein [Actinomadura alba]
MSETAEHGSLGPRMSLYDHALRLHHLNPDTALPRDGEPYPDEEHHRRDGRTRRSDDARRQGMDAAAILDSHFARSDAKPSELAWAFHDVDVPIHHNEHIAAAALRADRQRVQETGRWLVRHSSDRCSALIGTALLAADWADEDVEIIRTIGLLSERFGVLAAHALKRRRGGVDALLWLAERVAGWGRVYIVEALCLGGSTRARSWLLRRACDGDYLNGYFAGRVATAAHLHEAIVAPDADEPLIDHTGRLLKIMAQCGGMGTTWEHYPPTSIVLEAHAGHLAHQAPTLSRYLDAAHIADDLAQAAPDRLGITADHRQRLLDQYLVVLCRPDWSEAAQAGFDPDNDYFPWFAETIAARLRLPGFTEPDTDP